MASVIVFLALTAVLISSNANVNSDEEGEENMEVCPALEANPETSGDHENPKRMAFALGEVTFFGDRKDAALERCDPESCG